jgi:hypothetical protein
MMSYPSAQVSLSGQPYPRLCRPAPHPQPTTHARPAPTISALVMLHARRCIIRAFTVRYCATTIFLEPKDTDMPTVRKLNPQEVQTLERKGKGQRRLIEEQYDAFLADYQEGDYGEAELEEDENRLTVRNRFKKAAARRGIALAFQRTSGNILRFKVAPVLAAAAEVAFEASAVPPPGEAEPVVASDVPPKRRGGRRKAAATPAG